MSVTLVRSSTAAKGMRRRTKYSHTALSAAMRPQMTPITTYPRAKAHAAKAALMTMTSTLAMMMNCSVKARIAAKTKPATSSASPKPSGSHSRIACRSLRALWEMCKVPLWRSRALRAARPHESITTRAKRTRAHTSRYPVRMKRWAAVWLLPSYSGTPTSTSSRFSPDAAKVRSSYATTPSGSCWLSRPTYPCVCEWRPGVA
mmetsp:Transcript_43888/g.135488  ORF Transcript_43888/g.135488 Transcript_43888/m.135488 type:complete len:203 (-) Transcript_43888:279-887(-)